MSLKCPANVKSPNIFWDFYKTNTEDVERIIWDACWRHAETVDPHDMHQDLLVRLHRSNFLKVFDAKQSQLGTYFTQRVNGYARHIVTRTLILRRRRDQALCIEFNKTDIEHNAMPELALEPEMEDALDNEQTFKGVCDKLSDVQKRILQLYLEGHDSAEIAVMFGISIPALLDKWNRIKEMIVTTMGKDAQKALLVHWNNNVPEKRIVNKKQSFANGNGHATEKKRPLNDREKEILKQMFVDANGQIETDVCLEMKKRVGKDIGIAQITGYMVGLHSFVAKGKIVLRDSKAYYDCILAHRRKWASYKSAKYQAPEFQAKNA
jgi:RNA polymerase sigma factor (sigma-70 family)